MKSKRILKLTKKVFTFGLIISWLFTSWPQIPFVNFPEKVQKAQAAISATHLTAGSNTYPSDTGTTASISPTANALIIVTVGVYNGSGNPPTPISVIGNGITYELIDCSGEWHSGFDAEMVCMYRGLSASPTTGTIVITGDTGTGYLSWSVDEITGVYDTGGSNGSGAVIQSNTYSSGAGTTDTITVTLGTFASAGNGVLGTAYNYNAGTLAITKEAGLTELVSNYPNDNPETAWRNDNDTSLVWTLTADYSGGMAIEVNGTAPGTCDGGAVSNVVFIGKVNGDCIGFVSSTGAGTFTLPGDWSDTNLIEVIGAGGGGGGTSSGDGSGGGGGGAYATTTIASLADGVSYFVGIGGPSATVGSSTWFGATTCGAANVCAGGGGTATAGGTNANTGGAGGTVVVGQGYAGGAGGDGGGDTDGGGGGGGGAGGTTGIGAAGGGSTSHAIDGGSGGGGASGGDVGAVGPSTNVGGDGGANFTNRNGSPGGGGAGGNGTDGTAGTLGAGGGGGSDASQAANEDGGAGGNGIDLWGASPFYGSGGGGGGAGDNGIGGNGGRYGGGGGGTGEDGDIGGTGGQGLIVITYTPSLAPVFTLNSYRWYVDNDFVDPSNSWGNPDIAQDTAITILPYSNLAPTSTVELRLRTNFTVSSAALSAVAQQFKLQFKEGTDATCNTGSWTDVGAQASAVTWRFANSSVTTSLLSVTKLSPVSNVLESYVTTTPTYVNPNSVSVGEEMEYDFHIEHNGATSTDQYSFRVVESDNTEFDSYTNCPTLATGPETADLMRHGNMITAIGEQGFYWAN